MTGETPVLRLKGQMDYYMEVHMNNLYTAVTKKMEIGGLVGISTIPLDIFPTIDYIR